MALSELAREHGIWLVPGTVFERADDGRLPVYDGRIQPLPSAQAEGLRAETN